MVARLWWKEARLFWPIAAFLVLVAELTQVLTVYYFGPDARTGVLAVMAFGWTCLYAFAVAAASLAGERENGTLLLLDALPASRGSVWGAKTSFALGSTLALGVVFACPVLAFDGIVGTAPAAEYVHRRGRPRPASSAGLGLLLVGDLRPCAHGRGPGGLLDGADDAAFRDRGQLQAR